MGYEMGYGDPINYDVSIYVDDNAMDCGGIYRDSSKASKGHIH